MMNNNHKNSGCGFAEELISYLYGESDAAQSAAFETHLASCRACADELEAFSGVHFSINDWKLKEFANLETPVIEIPYPAAPDKRQVIGVKASWLSGLRNLFSLSPAWSLATASMAVLAVGIGIVLFAMNSRTGNDLAESNKTVKPVSLPTVEKTPDQTVANSNQNSSPDKESKPLKEQKAPQPEVAVEPNPKNNRAVKISNTQRQPQKAETTPKNNGVKNNKNEKEVAPVIPDEDEDDTLRLAELFEEIDTDE